MKSASTLRKACYAGIGAVEFWREQISNARKTIVESLDDFVKRGKRLDEREDSLTRALLAALQLKKKVPSTSEINSIIPGYDDLTMTEIVDQIKRLPLKELETVREYEVHNFNRVRIIRQIDRELDEARIIPDYDELSVSEAIDRLKKLTPQQLAALKDYEKTHRNRSTIIRAIDSRLEKAA
ncbi:MAG: hypothetical protein Kow0099_09190 [Candidatus Abyssubacteria bacterium]